MRNILIFSLMLLNITAVAAESLFPNGDLKKALDFVPLAKQVAAKGFTVKAPWPAGFLIDTSSQPCVMRYEAGDAPRLIVENDGKKESTVYTAAEFKPGKYKLRFKAKGLTPGSYVKVRIYRYNQAKRWAGGIVLHQIRLDGSREGQVLDFTENGPDTASFRIAFSFSGTVKTGDFELLDTASAAAAEPAKKKVILPPGTLLDEVHPPKIGERGSLIRKFAPVKKGQQTLLSFEHRIDFPRLGGWAPCMQIEINGKVVSGMATRLHKRLLNSDLRTSGHLDHGTYHRNYSDKWYSLYSPDFEAAKHRFSPVNPEAYRVVLDISDLVSSTEENNLRIRFGSDLAGYYKSVGVLDRKPALALQNLAIRQTAVVSPLPVEKEAADTMIIMRRKAPAVFKCELRKDGALSVDFNGRNHLITGTFSAPAGHRYTLGEKDGEAWQLREFDGSKVVLANPYYTFTREITIRSNRIDVKDTFASKLTELAGVKFFNRIKSDEFHPVYLAGDPSPVHEVKQGGRNPSVFLSHRASASGLGMIAGDDVFRVQNRQFCRGGYAGIGSENFALLPGKKQTVEWSVYPVASCDYFDFINLVRRDWQVNFPIQGGFHISMNNYVNWNREKSNAFADKLNLQFQGYGVLFWRHLGGGYASRLGTVHGFGLMLDEVRAYPEVNKTVPVEPMREFVRKNLALCKEYTPHLKRLIYVHNQYSNEPGDEEKYAGCRLIDLKGRKCGGMNGYYKLFVPTLENDFGKKHLSFLKYLFDNFDLDGIYNDEFTYSISFASPTMWDGVSVELDDNGNVKRKIGFIPLLKLPFSLKVMDYVINERGKYFIANFSPETRSELRFQVPRFEETYDPSWVYYTHLYTPIQLGDMLVFSGSPEEFMDDVRNAIKRGALYYHYLSSAPGKTITAYMYPFTPVELHSGYLVGKERILTIYSGEFGIPGETAGYEALVFGPDGSLIKNHPYENIRTPDGTKCRIILKKNHCAVLIKKNK